MTLAIVALFADGPTHAHHIGSWRVKETDRIAAMATELRKLGATVEAGAGLAARHAAGARCAGATIDTYDDHRMAMCFSLAALRRRPGDDQRPRLRAQDLSRVLRRLRRIVAAAVRRARRERSDVPAVPVIAIDGPAASGKGTVAARRRARARLSLPRQRLAVSAGGAAGAAAGVALDDERARWRALAAALDVAFRRRAAAARRRAT